MSTTPHAPKKSLLKKLLIIGAILFLGLLLFVGCVAALSGGSDPANEPRVVETEQTDTEPAETVEPTPEDTPDSSGSTIEMRATATGGGTVYWDVDGGSNTIEFIDGWTQTVENVDPFDYFYFSVSPNYMTADANSVVTCELYVDGELKDKSTGTGDMGSASCSTL